MQIVNEITLHYTKKTIGVSNIGTSRAAYIKAQWMYSETHTSMDLKEYFFVMFLNNQNELIGFLRLSEGGINQTTADIRLAFATALKSLACAVILIHNHPSGKLEPSIPDRSLTKQFKEAGRILEIPVLDHLIIATKGYYSFADEGLI